MGDTNSMAPIVTRQARVIDLLVTGLPVSQVARLSGVGRRTVYDWQADPEFCDRLQRRRQEVAGRLDEDIAELGRLAVAVLKDYLSEEPTDNYDRRERVKLARGIIGDLGMIHAQNRTRANERAEKPIN